MGKEFTGILRTTFLIDKKGKIIKIWKNVKVKDHAQDVLKVLKKVLKFKSPLGRGFILTNLERF